MFHIQPQPILTRVVLRVPRMKLLGKLLVGVGLDTQGFADGKHLEQEGESASKSLADLCRQEGLVVLHHIEEGALSLDIFGGKRRVRAHPELGIL